MVDILMLSKMTNRDSAVAGTQPVSRALSRAGSPARARVVIFRALAAPAGRTIRPPGPIPAPAGPTVQDSSRPIDSGEGQTW